MSFYEELIRKLKNELKDFLNEFYSNINKDYKEKKYHEIPIDKILNFMKEFLNEH